MVYDNRVYSVLVVSSSEKTNESLRNLMSAAMYEPVVYVESVAMAKRVLLENSFDFVIVNSPLRDDTGVRFAIDVCSGSDTVCMLLAKAETIEETHYAVVKSGVFAVPRPTSERIMVQSFRHMAAARERLRKLSKKTVTLEEKMEEIRIVNRAKWILIQELKMDESDAHKYIEKQAMDNCVSKRRIAEDIIKTYQ